MNEQYLHSTHWRTIVNKRLIINQLWHNFPIEFDWWCSQRITNIAYQLQQQNNTANSKHFFSNSYSVCITVTIRWGIEIFQVNIQHLFFYGLNNRRNRIRPTKGKERKKEKSKWKTLSSCAMCESFTVWIDTTLTWKCFPTNLGLLYFRQYNSMHRLHMKSHKNHNCVCVRILCVENSSEIETNGKTHSGLILFSCALYSEGKFDVRKTYFPVFVLVFFFPSEKCWLNSQFAVRCWNLVCFCSLNRFLLNSLQRQRSKRWFGGKI